MSVPPTTPRAGRLHEYLTRLAWFGYSGAVLVAENDQVSLSQGYGWADRRQKRPVEPGTLFSIGSLSKPLTAAAVLKLVEGGQLSLSASLADYLPGLPGDKAFLTAHHLLTHTSGLADWPGASPRLARDEFLAGLFAQELEDEPGEFAYSNAGYQVLAALIELVSGQAYEEYLRQNLFDPAGMQDSGFTWEVERWSVSQLAQGYGGVAEGYPLEADPSWQARGSTGVLSTVHDLYRWETALKNGRILAPEQLELYGTAFVDIRSDFYFKYGYGWRHQRRPDGTPVVWHSGYEGQFSAQYVRFVGENVLLIALWNAAWDLQALRDIFLPVQREGPGGPLVNVLFGTGKQHGLNEAPACAGRLSEADLQKLAGVYGLASGGRLRAWVEDGRLVLFPEGQDAVAALLPAVAENELEIELQAWNDKIERAFSPGRAAAAAEAAGGDYKALLEPLGPFDPLDVFGGNLEMIVGQWRLLEQKYGKLKAVAVLGSAPRQPANLDTIVTALRLDFERAALPYSLVCLLRDDPNEHFLLPGAPASFEQRLCPLSETEFQTFDFLQRGNRVIRFEVAEGSAAAELIIETDAGEIRARR